MVVSSFLLHSRLWPAAPADAIVGKLFLKKSIKESFRLGKSGFDYIFTCFSVQSVQFSMKSTSYLRKIFSESAHLSAFHSENIFQNQEIAFFKNSYKLATTTKSFTIQPEMVCLFAKVVRDEQETSFKIVQAADRQNEKYFL